MGDGKKDGREERNEEGKRKRDPEFKKGMNITSNLHYNEIPGSNKTFGTTFCLYRPTICTGFLCFCFFVSLRPFLNIFHKIYNFVKGFHNSRKMWCLGQWRT